MSVNRILIPMAYADLTAWPRPDCFGLNPTAVEIYRRRKEAVEMYADGTAFQEIRNASNISDDEVRRLVKRCVVLKEDGFIYGFFALLPGVLIKSYERKKSTAREVGDESAGCSGALKLLFTRFPEIEELVNDLYFKKHSNQLKVHEARISIKNIHEYFLKALRKLGLGEYDWPFNTQNAGYKSLYLYCRDLANNINQRAGHAYARLGRDASRRGAVGTGYKPLISNLRPYSFMQLDFHKIDAASIIVIRNDYGVEVPIPVSRWHIGFLVDEFSAGIAGAFVALEKTPSGDSTLEVISSSLTAEQFIKEDPRARFVDEGKALLVQLIPGLENQCFSALKIDNGWSNAAHDVVNNIMDVIGCAVNFGPCYSWWRRDLIEKIFGELTRNGLQRMPSTYGSGVADSKINKPSEKAIKFRILLSELISILFGCIREHNLRKSERSQNSSPVQILEASLSRPASGFFPYSIPDVGNTGPMLLMHIEEVTVRGNLARNERPYFKLDRCRYTNPLLASSYRFLGKKLITYTYRRRCCIVYATVKETGENLGLMIAGGSWTNSECSWRDRKLINRSSQSFNIISDSESTMRTWVQQKSEEVSNRKKKTRAQTSADALVIANVISREKSTQQDATENSVVPSENADTTNDPFGLLIDPPMKVFVRRSR